MPERRRKILDGIAIVALATGCCVLWSSPSVRIDGDAPPGVFEHMFMRMYGYDSKYIKGSNGVYHSYIQRNGGKDL